MVRFFFGKFRGTYVWISPKITKFWSFTNVIFQNIQLFYRIFKAFHSFQFLMIPKQGLPARLLKNINFRCENLMQKPKVWRKTIDLNFKNVSRYEFQLQVDDMVILGQSPCQTQFRTSHPKVSNGRTKELRWRKEWHAIVERKKKMSRSNTQKMRALWVKKFECKLIMTRTGRSQLFDDIFIKENFDIIFRTSVETIN